MIHPYHFDVIILYVICFISRQTKDSSQYSKKSGVSSESYVSAISSAEDFLQDKSDGSRMHFQPLVSPGLLLAYSNYMQPLSCINWQQNVPCCMRKKFSLLKNLKVTFNFFHCFLFLWCKYCQFNICFEKMQYITMCRLYVLLSIVTHYQVYQILILMNKENCHLFWSGVTN